MYKLRRSTRSNKNINNNTKSSKSKKNKIMQTTEYTQEIIPTTTGTPTYTPTHKRLRDVQNNSFAGNVTKSPRISIAESPLKLITTIDKRFDKLTEQIQNMMEIKFKEYRVELLSDLDERLNMMKSELQAVKERVTLLETATDDLRSMKEEIKTLKTKIKHQENHTVSCDLRLNEIPFYENEDLMNIFCNICNTIETSVPAIQSIYRLQNQNNKHKNVSKDAVIIVKMWSAYDKNFFLKSLANFRKLNKGFSFTLRDIGLNSDNKFYVNENLTQFNFNILRAAIRLKKKNLLHSAFTLRGLVYIKRGANDNLIHIEEIGHLHQLFPEDNPAEILFGNSSNVSNL